MHRTSSGKSTVANAILGGKILPVGMGDTTNCFITMQGTNQPEPFMIHPLHPESPQSVHVRTILRFIQLLVISIAFHRE